MVLVAGMGMITSIGRNVPECWQSILLGKDGLSYAEILETIHKNDITVGEIKLSNRQLEKALKLQPDTHSRTTLLGIWAIQEALQSLEQRIGHYNTAFINATSVGGMSDVENLYDEMISPDTNGKSQNYIDSLDCADCTMSIARHYGLKGFLATISTACSSSANAILMGARMLQAGECDIAICGGTDALTRFTLNGFNALKNVDKAHCRPFDQNRNGLNLGEAAGYIILANEGFILKENIQPLARFAGYGNTNEAHHPTAPSPDGSGALLTMQQALDNARIVPSQIDYINAHGTATLGNDLSEGNAMARLFENSVPPFSSTKAYTGHTLAASGVVEAIISCMAIREQAIPPNLRFETPMEEIDLAPAKDIVRDMPVRYVLSNSFAFGGNNVSLVFEKP